MANRYRTLLALQDTPCIADAFHSRKFTDLQGYLKNQTQRPICLESNQQTSEPTANSAMLIISNSIYGLVDKPGSWTSPGKSVAVWTAPKHIQIERLGASQERRG